MKINNGFILLVALLLAGCEKSYQEDSDFDSWAIGVARAPEFYSFINDAYGVNYEEDWTSGMPSYASGGGFDVDMIRKVTSPDYDGYGIPLTSYNISTRPQLNLFNKELPDEIYVYWTAYNNYFDYATVIAITPQIKAAMTKVYRPEEMTKQQRKKAFNRNCYQTDFILGLLPDGRAKLWLKGCLFYTYVGEYLPTRVKDIRESYPGKARQKVVPWNKAEQVWLHTNNYQYQLQDIEDVVPRASLED